MSMFKAMTGRWLSRLVTGVLAISVAACGGGGGSAGEPPFGGGGGGGTRTVADLSVVLSRTTVANNGTDSVGITVTSLDASRVALGSVPVSFAIDNGGVITPAGTSTDSNSGIIEATASIGADRTNRTIKVTVSSGTISKQVSFDVVDSVTGGKVADLSMTTNRSTIPNDASAPMLVTVTTLDANRQAIGGSPLTFSVSDPAGTAFVSSGGSQVTDNTSGQLVATVAIGSNRSNRTLTLVATSGTVTRAISFDVVDQFVTVPLASDLSLVLSTQNIGNTGSDVVDVTATAVDGRRNAVANIPITFEVNANATITVQNTLSDANGQAKAKVTIGSDRSERLITVTARSDGLTPRTATFRVTGVSIVSTAVPALPAAGSSAEIEFRVVDVNQNPMIDIPITVTPSVVAASESEGPVVKTGTTNINGAYKYTYKAPAQSGLVSFTALAAGKTKVQEVTVPSPTTQVPLPTKSPSSLTLTLTPNVVRVNTGADTENRAEIRALFLAADNSPVANVRVRFVLVDPNSIGGTISTGAETVYSDAIGVATSSYKPGERASPTNGQTIRACWKTSNFSSTTDCPNFSDISLTVVADPLSITIGTDNRIEDGASGLTYIKRFVLLVVDAAGNPKADVQLTPSVDLQQYRKGFYFYNDAEELWLQAVRATCTNEDANRNGAIDAGEDINGNGQLDPRKSDVSISMVGSTRTDANGTALMKLEYPKNFGSWVQAKIAVAAAGVLSPPAFETRWLDVASTELTSKISPPSFVNSPYGLGLACTDPN